MVDDRTKKYGSKRGFAAAWGGLAAGFMVGGPIGAIIGAVAGEGIARKINTGSFTGKYEEDK